MMALEETGRTPAGLRKLAIPREYVLVETLAAGAKGFLALDVGGYRERRQQQLEQMALRLGRQVKATGEAIILEPLDPAERRIIHIALQGDNQVGTESVGDGRGRRLVIRPTGVNAFRPEQESP